MKLPSVWPVVAGALGLLLWWAVRVYWQNDGALRERIKARETVIAALAKQRARVDTSYAVDTAALAAWRRKYADLRAKIATTRPPEISNPLVVAPADTSKISRLIVVADSTIAACSVALETCERRVAVRDSIIAATNDLLALERKRRPGWFGCVVGPTVDTKGFGVGGSCGIRLK